MCTTRKLVSKREEISEHNVGPATDERMKSGGETREKLPFIVRRKTLRWNDQLFLLHETNTKRQDPVVL